MKHTTLSKVITAVLCVAMLFSLFPATVFADWDNVVYDGTTFGTNGYYNVISQKEYTLVPGAATETEMVINNSSGSRRQVMHIIEVDPSNPDISIIPGYYGIDKDLTDINNWKAKGVTDMVKYYEDVLGYNVVGAMNTSLAYDNNAPIDFLVYNGENLSQGAHHAQTFLAVIKDPDTGAISCELHNYGDGIPENCWQAVSANFGFTVNNGELVNKTEERTSSAAARSMLGVKEDGTLVIVMNDGRGANNSVGFCTYELGESMLALGCKWAVNCDGGGSSSFVTKRAGETVNTMRCVPCDGSERPTLNSILITSNIGPTGELNNVDIVSGYDYFAPGTTYSFAANAIDTHGYGMELPADMSWALSDPSFGTVSNGVFVSNGTLGDVDVQIVSNGNVVGSKTIHIANPSSLYLSATSTTLPYSTADKPRSVNLPIVAKIGEADVYYDTNVFSITSSVEGAGSINGFTFTATTDESIEGTVLTITYQPTGQTLTYTIGFGKGSEILWDFENGIDGWLGQQDAHDWQVAHGVTPFDEDTSVANSLIKAGQMNASSRSKTFLSTRENGGQVHNGNYALGVEYDFRGADFNSWVYQILFNVLNENGENPDCVLRDVENGKNATAIGMWLYLPVGFYDVKNSGALALQMNLYYRKADGTEGQTGVNMQYNGRNINSLTEADIPDGRWIYVKGQLPNQPYIALTDPMQSNFRAPSIFRMYIKPSIAQTLTYYYDDITLDYSDAVDDRDNPVITDPCYALNDTAIALDNGAFIDGTSIDFSANAADFNASNMTGINASSAAIYLDGVLASDAKYVNGQITGGGFTLAEGEHTVIFEIKDNIGNISQLKRTFTCTNATNKGIYLAGHNNSGDAPEAGSVYYIDVKAENVENVQKAVATIDLQTANEWEVEHMTVADGFDVTYDVNEAEPEFVTFHITNTGSSLSGDQTIVSIPVRVWDWDESWPFGGDGSAIRYGKAERYAAYGEPVLQVEANITYGLLNDAVPFGGSISVATKVNGNKTNGLWHTHDAELTVQDQAPTCISDGYTGRTCCETCGSIVDWGTKIPATGHSYVMGPKTLKFIISDNGANQSPDLTFEGGIGYYYENGEYKTFETDATNNVLTFTNSGNFANPTVYYWFDGEEGPVAWPGVAMTYYGQNEFNQAQYTFEMPEAPIVLHCTSCGEIFNGLFEDGKYYFDGVMAEGWIDNSYYDNGVMLTGVQLVDGYYYDFGEDGVSTGKYTGLFEMNGKYYYAIAGNLVSGWQQIEDDYYYFDPATYTTVETLNNGYVTYTFEADGKLTHGVWYTTAQGTRYFYGPTYWTGKQAADKMVVIDGNTYYFNKYGYRMEGHKYVKLSNQDIYQWYDFGDDGILRGEWDYTGFAEQDGYLYYVIDGLSSYGMHYVDGAYYYSASPNRFAVVMDIERYCPVTNGLLPKDTYRFGSDGKMLNEVVYCVEGTLYYFVMGKQSQGTGVVTFNGVECTLDETGKVDFTGYAVVTDGRNLYFEHGVTSEWIKNGLIHDNDGEIRYYEDGVPTRAGLVKDTDGSYYYINSTLKAVKNCTYSISDDMTNGLLPAGKYTFGADGKMIDPPGQTPDPVDPPEVKNGLYHDEDGEIRYYENGVPTRAGLVQDTDGSYYYINSTLKAVKNCSYSISDAMANGLMPGGRYTFGEDGKMIDPPGQTPDPVDPPEVKNGLYHDEDGEIRYYENGVPTRAGLVQDTDGSYYYINSTLKAVKNCAYSFSDAMANGLMPGGRYHFDENGVMTDPRPYNP